MADSHEMDLGAINQPIIVNADTEEVVRLQKELNDAYDTIDNLNDEVDDLTEKLARLSDQSQIPILEEQLKRFGETAKRSAQEFAAFLKSVHMGELGDADAGIESYFEDIRRGYSTAGEAISNVKAYYSDLVKAGNESGGAIDAQQIGVMLSMLNELRDSISELKANLQGLQGGFSEIGGGGGGVATVAASALSEITTAAAGMSEEARDSATSLASLVKEIADLGSLDQSQLYGIMHTFRGLGEISHGGIGEKTVTNVTNLAKAMQDMGGSGTIRVDFSGFKDLKISKASMSNLAEYLPKIADVNVDNLIKLSDVDLSKFNNLKISKGAVEELAKVADAVKIFQAIPSVSTGVGDAGIKIDTAGSGLGDIKDNLLTLAKTTTTFYEEGKKEVKEYANAQGDVVERIIRTTNAKGEESIVTEKVNNIRKRETEETNKATRAAELYDNAMRKVGDAIKYNKDATGSEVSAIKDQKAAIDDLYNSFMGKQGYNTIAAGDLDAFKKGVAEALHSATTAVKDNKAAVAENKRETTEAARAQETYKKAIYEANEALSRRSATLGDRGVQSKAYADIQAQAQAIKDLYAGYATGNVGYDEFTTRMASALRNLRSATKDYTEEQKQELEVERQLQSARNDAAKSIESGKQALADYAAVANKAKNRDAYTNLRSNIAAYDELDRKLEAGTISAEEYIEKTRQLDSEIKKNTNTLKQNENAHSALGAKLKSVVAMYFSFTRVISYAVRAVREMVQASMELDKALTQMQIVTGANNAEMERFADTAFEAAGRAASNITDIISGATTYARLGFDTQTSTALAEYTAMLQNVGDINAQDAQDAITAIIKAFDGVDETNIKEKLDELVVVGNNFPVSVSQVAEGMNNASSALAAAGNTYEKSVALLTAANTTIEFCRAA